MRDVGVDLEEFESAPARVATLPFDDGGFADFAVAGASVAGDFRCTDCGYGAIVQRTLPPCPMCGGTMWECRGPLHPSRLAD